MPVITRHIAMQTRIQDWTRVRILMRTVVTDHWTKALPLVRYLASWLRLGLGLVI